MKSFPKKNIIKSRTAFVFKKDYPWMVRSPLTMARYTPRMRKEYIDVERKELREVRMLASKARKFGFELGKGVPDTQLVKVEIMQTVHEMEKVFSLNLYDRAVRDSETDEIHISKYSRPRNERYELAEVRKNPRSYVYIDKFQELLEDEISFWETNCLPSWDLKPRILCLLSLDETEKKTTVSTRSLFYIQYYNPCEMVIIDSKGNKHFVLITEETRKKCRVLDFIMFVPSNGFLVDANSGKKIA